MRNDFPDVFLQSLQTLCSFDRVDLTRFLICHVCNFQLAELRAEYGVLARTEEILKGKDESFQHQLVSTYISTGVYSKDVFILDENFEPRGPLFEKKKKKPRSTLVMAQAIPESSLI